MHDTNSSPAALEIHPHHLVLSPDEIIAITHRKRAREQLRDLIALGIPATRRFDNTICVLRVDAITRRSALPAPVGGPQRKSVKK